MLFRQFDGDVSIDVCTDWHSLDFVYYNLALSNAFPEALQMEAWC